MKVLFLGSPNFAKKILEGILSAGHQVVAVICQPDRPASRGHKMQMPAVKEYAIDNGIKVMQFEKVNNNLDEIRALDFDIFVTASFGQILSREFLGIKMGLNVHPSLLPKFRGATPIQTALLYGCQKTGVTIQRMVYEVDAGDVIEQEEVDVYPEDDYVSLENRLSEVSVKLLTKALNDIENGEVNFVPQQGEPTFTRMIKKEDGRLDFSQPSEVNVNKVRALAHNPGCYFEIGGQRVKVLAAATSSDNAAFQPKDILPDKKHFLIKCDCSVIEILKLISPSGKIVDGKSFLNGLRNAKKVD